ncbi:hypothetical protein [Salinimicrobium terrae]|uniref:hypothetical protein n=1 Tax=Salinimicrobium terrae TaxID=470866 RepID=UPI000417C1F1|nr:hypothetical protein [Salinimicrobium terrae]
MKLDGTNKLVSYSRAGDVFHYRWAARRCLRLIQPITDLKMVVIEGSKEKEKAGEYVIDVSEYYNGTNSKKRVEYYQLKHTTVQKDKPFTLSGLKDTIVGFSERYQQHAKEKSIDGVFFTVITNRKVDQAFKQNIATLVKGGKVNKKFGETLKGYTQLDGKELIAFCRLLNFEDGEGDYNIQKEDLRMEMARLQPGLIDPAQIDSIVSLVQEKVLPHSSGKITKEDILRPFGVTSERQLFPAPPLFEEINGITYRDQYQNLLNTITSINCPLIIQAEGGVGKSVFSQYVLEALPEGSLGIAYDCFGSGKYRNRSEPRHRHRDGLVQIVNELASMGLCERMLVRDTTQETDIMNDFLSRIDVSIKTLKKVTKPAKLVIIIDAADNAEMAAQEFGDSCFANELLREILPIDCSLVLLCRPERIHLLKPPSSVTQLDLLPFSKEETFANLKNYFPEVNKVQAFEFHRLTNGNPRVQMNAIAAAPASLNELLVYLGPFGTTVEKQIEHQLNTAVQKIKDALPRDYQTSVDKICTGLSILPPNIPIKVLAQVAEVRTEHVKSFVADIGRSLWLLDSSVQFRDEPTETWFRDVYLGTKNDFNSYIKILEPLAVEFTYVAEVLPQIYLQAGQYDRLITIALSDKLLPLNNPIDTRNVIVFRLQFAFKAALRSQNYKDAIKLALRAGEEVAGDQRQQNLFLNNIDLLPQLQDKFKVQEIAFKGLLKSNWEGSENMYSAFLLSEIKEFHGEASGYQRSALNWLDIYFEESKRNKDHDQREGVSFDDILELALVQLNLNGVKSCLKFLNSFKPKEFIFQVVKRLANRLIDAGRFNDIAEFLKKAQNNKFFVVAVVSELEKVGWFAEIEDLEKTLNLLSGTKTRIKKPKDPIHDNITPSIITFLEVCLHRKMNPVSILNTLAYYIPDRASHGVGSRYDSKERVMFLKAHSIRYVLSENLVVQLDDLMPKLYKSENQKRNYTDDIREFKEVIGGLLPWFFLRAQVISGNIDDLSKRTEQANKESKKAYINRYKSHDVLPSEIAEVSASILLYCIQQESKVIEQYFNDYIRNTISFKIPNRIILLRAGTRAAHLTGVINELENSTYELIKGLKNARPEEIADHYISIARAVLSSSKDDAAVYFEEAINIVSKFGDEIVNRWEAVVSLGELSASHSSQKLAYRFIRVAELVGEYVYREKHWSRSGAMVTCAKMSPQVGISALSRWRDREIGRFEYQLQTLLDYLVKSKIIEPAEGWSLARLLEDHHLTDFLSTCLANESSDKIKQEIFDDAYNLLRTEGATAEFWMKLKSIGDLYNITNENLEDTARSCPDTVREVNTPHKHLRVLNRSEAEIKKWDRIFQDIEFLKPKGFALLLNKFSKEFQVKDEQFHWRSIDLFEEAITRTNSNHIQDLIDVILSSEDVSQYESQQCLNLIFDRWKNKVSFKKKWPTIMYRYGQRYAFQLVSDYSFSSIVRELDLNDSLALELRKGIFEGLSQGQEFVDASVFFEFVKHALTFISTEDTSNLTDYALSRFELHMEEDFGDGPWSEWLYVSDDISRSVAGFIWSALGSPRSKIRWSACHVIKKLADFNCSEILNYLIEWLQHDKVDAFGSKHFPFYNLHAKQYLLIALYRVSVDHFSILFDHRKIFMKYAVLEPHIIIQKFSAEIALYIEKNSPGSYSAKEVSLLKGIGKSKQKVKKEDSGFKVDSYLHKNGKVNTGLKSHFGYDFDRYWLEPLGEAFGVPRKQIQELCANVIVAEWKLESKTGFSSDPRVSLWNQSQDRETWHDHGSYPKTDDWDFYVSYHSMLNVAAKLVENMPVIITRNSWSDENPWNSWLSRHLLTRKDGKWLADSRDLLPLERPEWITKGKSDNWRTTIQDHEFLKGIMGSRGKETWFNIKGGWTERHNSHYESYSVSTALVSKMTADALMRALSTCSDCHDFKIPDYKENRVEIASGIFKLEGWILDLDFRKGLDELDPYGKDIGYPPFSLGEKFLKRLNLHSDNDGKTWYFSEGAIGLKCDTWRSDLEDYDEEPEQHGMRLSASLELLKKLCETYNCNLIFEINISRNISYKFRSKDDKYEYLTHHKIYLLSADGRLKSTTENFELG